MPDTPREAMYTLSTRPVSRVIKLACKITLMKIVQLPTRTSNFARVKAFTLIHRP